MYRNSEFLTKIALTSSFDAGDQNTSASLFDELASLSFEPDRHNRLCVTVSDIHLTDGTVGIQNLFDSVWDSLFDRISTTCKKNQIKEVVLIFDGDFIDLIRSDVWAKTGVYPWQRDNQKKFNDNVRTIIKNIIGKHSYFFGLLKEFDKKLKKNASCVEATDIIVLLGNHDKDLMLDNHSLSYFYENALGRKLESFSDAERAYIGKMYGDKDMFLRDKSMAPYFPFYHADKGFRFFTTHGQWRDGENSRAVEAEGDKPGWNVNDGWQQQVWEKLNYRPFLDACFGDSVAAGLLSTFIYKTKEQLSGENIDIERLNRILDELDLYRPSYLAIQRILEESRKMKKQNKHINAVRIIEDNLSECVEQWLHWDFTLQSASKNMRIGLRVARFILKLMKNLGKTIELTAILWGMKLMAFLSHHRKSGVDLKKMRGFPGFMPPYSTNGFQIHGEGHTHNPLQEEANLDKSRGEAKEKFNSNFTYVNFGTWRDQIVPRQDKGYRRRSVLRAFNILDLQADETQLDKTKRRFEYHTQDFTIWRDSLDRIEDKAVLAQKEAVL